MATTAAWLVLLIGLITGMIIIQRDVEVATKDIKDVTKDSKDNLIEVKNTDVKIIGAYYNNTTGNLTISVQNTGSESINTNQLMVLIDGESFENFTTSGSQSRSFIYPSESWNITLTASVKPSRIKIVVNWGISAVTTDIQNI